MIETPNPNIINPMRGLVQIWYASYKNWMVISKRDKKIIFKRVSRKIARIGKKIFDVTFRRYSLAGRSTGSWTGMAAPRAEHTLGFINFATIPLNRRYRINSIGKSWIMGFKKPDFPLRAALSG